MSKDRDMQNTQEILERKSAVYLKVTFVYWGCIYHSIHVKVRRQIRGGGPRDPAQVIRLGSRQQVPLSLSPLVAYSPLLNN